MLKQLYLVTILLPTFAIAAPFKVQVLDLELKPISGVAVYLESDGLSAVMNERLINQPHEIMQEDQRFTPYISIINMNSSVFVSNHDDISHHIYSFNGPSRFSFKLKAEEEHMLEQISETGVISMGCNVHDWMSGYLLVVDTPHYGITDEYGWVTFGDVGVTEFTAIAWHPQFNEPETLSKQTSLSDINQIQLVISQEMDAIPQQESINDLDFLEGY